MKPSASVTFRRTLWMGVAIGIGFRTFAYGFLWGVCLLPDTQGLSPLLENVAQALFCVVALALLTAILWVPFIAGFLSAYCWNGFESSDQMNAVWLSALLYLLVPLALWLILDEASIFVFSFLFLGLDVWMCGKGANRGDCFWNSRQSRQFMGDFSTDDWKGDGKTLS